MQRRAAELDREITHLRRSLGNTAHAPTPRQEPVTPASTSRLPTEEHWRTPSTPPPPLSERASGVMEELSRNIRRVVTRAQSPGRAYGEIRAGSFSSGGGASVLPPPMPPRGTSFAAEPADEQAALQREREARRRRLEEQQAARTPEDIIEERLRLSPPQPLPVVSAAADESTAIEGSGQSSPVCTPPRTPTAACAQSPALSARGSPPPVPPASGGLSPSTLSHVGSSVRSSRVVSPDTPQRTLHRFDAQALHGSAARRGTAARAMSAPASPHMRLSTSDGTLLPGPSRTHRGGGPPRVGRLFPPVGLGLGSSTPSPGEAEYPQWLQEAQEQVHAHLREVSDGADPLTGVDAAEANAAAASAAVAAATAAMAREAEGLAAAAAREAADTAERKLAYAEHLAKHGHPSEAGSSAGACPSPLAAHHHASTIAAEQRVAEWHCNQLRASAYSSTVASTVASPLVGGCGAHAGAHAGGASAAMGDGESSSHLEASPTTTSPPQATPSPHKTTAGHALQAAVATPSPVPAARAAARAAAAAERNGGSTALVDSPTADNTDSPPATGTAASVTSSYTGMYSAPVSPASVYPSPYQPSHRWGAPLVSPSTASQHSSVEPSPAPQHGSRGGSGGGGGRGSLGGSGGSRPPSTGNRSHPISQLSSQVPSPLAEVDEEAAAAAEAAADAQDATQPADTNGHVTDCGEAQIKSDPPRPTATAAAPLVPELKRASSAPLAAPPPPVHVGDDDDDGASPPPPPPPPPPPAAHIADAPDVSDAHIAALWPPARVGEWLCAIGLSEHAPTFVSEHVDGAALGMLSRDDLDALGVRTVGHRLQILRAIGELGLAPTAQQNGQILASGGAAATNAVRELRFNEAGAPAEHDVTGTR